MNRKMNLSLPEDVKMIIETINKAGYEAFAVGGCIRDMILGRIPNDFDITTSATPETVKSLFRRTVDTGIEHGTVTVLIQDKGYEVTTYRIDGIYEDNRHPSSVDFTSNLEEDLRRRDFTINAMAYNDEKGLVDPFDGEKDIERKVIRCVGVPKERFSEDALRIMRAVRFSAQLGYSIEEETSKAMKELRENLKDVSAERIREELVKMIVSDNPGRIRTAYELGITGVVLPEFDRMMKTPQNNPHHMYNVGEHTIKSMELIRNDRILRLAMLFHDMGKPICKSTDREGIDHFYGHPRESKRIAKEVLRRLKFDNNTIETVSKLAFLHDAKEELTPKGVRKAVNRTGKDIFVLLFEVRKADVLAQSEYKREEKLGVIETLKQLYCRIEEDGDCTQIKELAVDGKDLIQLGYKSGPKLGEELHILLEKVLDEPSLNRRETLLKLAQEDLK